MSNANTPFSIPEKRQRNIGAYLGFGGMHPDENPHARRWANRFEIPMVIIAIWIFAEWHLITNGKLSATTTTLMDWVFWGFFLFETVLLSLLATQPLRHLRRNWANLLIIVAAFPVWFSMLDQVAALRTLRLFLLIGYFAHHSNVVRKILGRHHLGTILVIIAMVITAGGFMISAIDPAFKSPGDGIWWAWVSMTTVGYGDIVPTTTEGRVLAALIILTGIIMLSLITANITAYFFSEVAEKEIRLEYESLRRLHQLEEHLLRLEKKLDELSERKP